jgi:hypothetical protein
MKLISTESSSWQANYNGDVLQFKQNKISAKLLTLASRKKIGIN